ncbi:Actin cortical patch SUR7/pH-response regulator PalI [Phaffia rhodozyma]|uniref:Actin cortical patch SUR7/pH-response regulator PalI n=1 Tax=Phaffia rhodozyma TaxID=264483 RepID=A0A0F7SXZ9_PHARH|nr:Actin cortical patch SUR7/pH-response regulator PalI [Phaffia rhodozyma]
MRGAVCISAGSFFSLAASIIMVFAHIGQINTSAIPRVLSMIKIDVNGLGTGISAASPSTSVSGLYANTTSLGQLGSEGGLRQSYRWGLLNSAGYTDGTFGTANSSHFGLRFKPFEAILSDVPSSLQSAVSSAVPSSTFTDGGYTGRYSIAAFYIIFIGSCLAFLTFLFGVVPQQWFQAFAALLSTISALALAVGAAIWTALWAKIKTVNGVTVGSGSGTNLGIRVVFGNGIILTWVAFGVMLFAIIPYFVSFRALRRDWWATR